MSMCWPAGFPARISAKLAFVLALLSAPAPDSGMSSLAPFAFFDPASSSWKTSQGSLLPDSESLPPTWSRSGIWADGAASERRMSEPHTVATESSSLLPTPSAYESTPSDEFTEEVRESLLDPHSRLYLPGRKWHAQRTLARMAGALLPTPRTNEMRGPFPHDRPENQDNLATRVDRLLPTPGANDHTGPELETREARQEEGNTGGPSLRDLPKLLPTPMTDPSSGNGHARNLGKEAKLLPTPTVQHSSRRSTARKEDWTSNTGTTLTDALWEAEGRETDTQGNLLPTPTARDRKGKSLRGPTRSDNGKPRSDKEKPLSDLNDLLPTSPGASTKPPSSAGKPSSDDQPPGQLTIEDA